MAYNALWKMRERNEQDYGVRESVRIPALPETQRSYGREALLFLRDGCEDLRFDVRDPARAALTDHDGRSAAPNQIPYNMERDLDRLSFERAIGRFLASGSREDAFDIYFCYCEIFRPFGEGYDSTGLLLKLLGEHESNASSLLAAHRDHYSHSVYEFLLGLAIYRNVPAIRDAYNARYGLREGKEAACHFLEYWGLTALFHDIGYPFEIAHQQMKAYVCALDPNNNDDYGFAPYVSYKHMDEFCVSRLGDLNQLYAGALADRLAQGYLPRAGAEAYYAEHQLLHALRDRAVHENPREKDYLFMDHAYFSALMIAKAYLSHHREIRSPDDMPREVLDAFCAILLHNSLFKFTLRSLLHTSAPLGLRDGLPLAYLLMLCDELQCWDRVSYGQNTRGGVFAFDFDLAFGGGRMKWIYYYDSACADRALAGKAYKSMLYDGYAKKSGAVRTDRSKFADDIGEIIALRDILPDFEPDVKKPDPSRAVEARLEPRRKRTGHTLSESGYLHLYEFALLLHGSRVGAKTPGERQRAFEEQSLEYRLSGLARVKGLAAQLETVGCFYSDRALDYEPVPGLDILTEEPGHRDDLEKIAVSEHRRWCDEKRGMGWDFGRGHVGAVPLAGGGRANDRIRRERTRLHDDLVDYALLDAPEKAKDVQPLAALVGLLRDYDGLTVYRAGTRS